MPTENNFDVKKFLANIGKGRKIVSVRHKQKVFAQGDACDAVYYIQKGKIKITVVSKAGKEATIAVLNETDFFGEGCLASQPLRMQMIRPLRVLFPARSRPPSSVVSQLRINTFHISP
jgi:CRP/FNR family cyclic AMP-dependent transcriptional regulator